MRPKCNTKFNTKCTEGRSAPKQHCFHRTVDRAHQTATRTMCSATPFRVSPGPLVRKAIRSEVKWGGHQNDLCSGIRDPLSWSTASTVIPYQVKLPLSTFIYKMGIIILASSQDYCGLHEIKGSGTYQRTWNTVSALTVFILKCIILIN